MKLIYGFSHTPGNHCGSTALCDLLRHQGFAFDEALCFGLGGGLGFFYYAHTRSTPSKIFHGRTATLERDLCAHLGLDYEQGAGDDADRAWRAAQDFVDGDVPLILNVELSALPYYNTRTPFPGHRVVLAGYDDARGVAFLADNAFAELQTVTYADLRAAWQSPTPNRLFPLRNEWLAIKPTRKPLPLVTAMRAALRTNALEMNLDRAPHRAIMGMEMLAEEFADWGDAPDWAWCARFGYQIIERRGTGGGFFRKMYADYMRQVERLDAELRAANLSATMDEIAGEWTGLALQLKRVSEEKDRALFRDAARMIRRIAFREENFWGRVMDLV